METEMNEADLLRMQALQAELAVLQRKNKQGGYATMMSSTTVSPAMESTMMLNEKTMAKMYDMTVNDTSSEAATSSYEHVSIGGAEMKEHSDIEPSTPPAIRKAAALRRT